MKKNDEMPKVESKELRKFQVTRQCVVEFEFIVWAETRHDAEQIVERNASITEYTDSFGCDYEDEYYDTNNWVSKIEGVYSGSHWWNSEDMYIQDVSETQPIFKFEQDDWDDTDSVFESEELLIENWQEENGINDDEDENEDEQ